MSSKRCIAIATIAGAVVALIFVVTSRRDEEPSLAREELTRAELDLRDDVLYKKGSEKPFGGTLVEHYPEMKLKLAIEIRDGKPNGLSRGYYEDGKQEVEEHFEAGISNGTRIRWYQNGEKKSEAQIVDGKIEGTFTRWHDNGQKAAEAQMVAGEPHGLSQGWHRSGARKSRVELEHGNVVSKQFWDDGDA